MNRILVEIECIVTGKVYDFLLPADMTVRVARRKIADEIMEYEHNDALFPEEKNCYLADLVHGELLNDKYTLSEAGISGGNRLILV